MMQDDSFLGVMTMSEGLPRPDWEAVTYRISLLPKGERSAAWGRAERAWLEALTEAWGGGYRLWARGNCLLVTDLPEAEAERALSFMIRALRQIDELLERVGLNPVIVNNREDGLPGYNILIACCQTEDYLRYISYHYPEDHRGGMSAGLCLREQMVHTVAHGRDFAVMQATIAHELAHSHLATCVMPMWLEEGLVTLLEDAVAGGSVFSTQHWHIEQHQSFWTLERLKTFFWGEGFCTVEDGLGLAYALANAIVRRLMELDRPTFARFVRESDWQDGGAAACRDLYDCDLMDLVPRFILAERDQDWGVV